ncbi:hypothetical protein BHE90_000858 [Fusarium euwallaceae]|uniref:C2H2-type domain-containing protein n=1 Tax=Fusarium euwallaceae TaxID=1147111 RepID=A0A430M9E2_9HYPO|nr:hypothetical protein BHE90_000858 [Fusarium euwallaceae]
MPDMVAETWIDLIGRTVDHIGDGHLTDQHGRKASAFVADCKFNQLILALDGGKLRKWRRAIEDTRETMCQIIFESLDKQSRWICCQCHYGPWNVKIDAGCPNCGHWRCCDAGTGIYFPSAPKSERPTARPATPVKASSSREAPPKHPWELDIMVARTDTLKPGNLDQAISKVPHYLSLSQISRPASAYEALHNPACEAANEEHQQGDQKPSSGFGFRGHILGLGESSKAKLQANATGILEALGWRRRKETPEDDSSDSGADTPAESEASSSTLGRSVRDVATPGVGSDLEGLHSEESETGSTSEDAASFVGTPGEDLLDLPWFHQNVRRVLRGLLQQDFRTSAHHPGAQSAASTRQGQGAHQQQGSGSSKRTREHVGSGDEVDRGDSSKSRPKCARRPKGPATSRPFSCPFCKKDLQRYQACAKFGFTRVPHVKQHLHRKHGDEIDALVKNRLKQRSARGTEEEQWYGIFNLLFPGHSPRPASPYNDFTLSEQPAQALPDGVPIDEALYVPGVFLTTDSIEILHQSLVEDPVFADVRPEDIRAALDRGLSRAYMDQISRPFTTLQSETQQVFERENTDSEQSSSTQVFERGRDVSATDPSDEGEGVNECPRPDHLDSIPALHPESSSDVTPEEPRQDFPHDVNSSTNGPTDNQQPSPGDQLGQDDELGLDFSFTGDQPPPVSEWDYLFDIDSLLDHSVEESWQATDKV